MSSPYEIDVVILTWNDGEDALRAAQSALRSQGVDVRVVLIDNGSVEEVMVPDAYTGRVRVVRNAENRGVAGGRNQGTRLTSAPLVCFLDSDATLDPAALRAMAEALVADDPLGLAAPVYEGQAPEIGAGRAPGVLRKGARALCLTDRYGAVPRNETDRVWRVDFAIGACQLFRRSAFDAVGGLDEADLFGPEDVDFCLRLRAAGWGIVQVGDAHCVHVARRAFRRAFSRRGLSHAVAVTRFLWRHRGGTSRRVAVTSRRAP